VLCTRFASDDGVVTKHADRESVRSFDLLTIILWISEAPGEEFEKRGYRTLIMKAQQKQMLNSSMVSDLTLRCNIFKFRNFFFKYRI